MIMKMLLISIDFGLVVLIWMTQLIIYPSFRYYSAEELVNWHSKYTISISIIVMPLMLSQVALHAYSLFNEFNILKLVTVLLIIAVWINTFLFAVPLHNKIGIGNEPLKSAGDLVNINWYRTLLWSAIFAISLFDIIHNDELK